MYCLHSCKIGVLVCLWTTVAWGLYSGGDGSFANPYQLTCEADWRQLAARPEDWNDQFQVLNDIDFSTEVMPCIGTSKLPFSGVMDGGGCSLSHLVSDGRLDAAAITAAMPVPNPRRGGLFGTISGIVKDLVLVEPVIVASNTGNAGALAANVVGGDVSGCQVQGGKILGQIAGGLVGLAQNATLTACSAEAFITGELDSGGLIGLLQGGTVSQCKGTSWVVAEGGHTGGLVGASTGYIKNSYSEGVLVCSNDEVILGGLVGYHSGTLENCYANNTFLVWTLEFSGGLIGKNVTGGNYWHCFWNQEKSPTRRAVGNSTADRADARAEDLQNSSFLQQQGWDLVFEIENGTEDLWYVDDGVDFPRLVWEARHLPPVAAAGPDQALKTSSTSSMAVQLNGSGSYDLDGDIVQWLWTWVIDGISYQTEGERPIVLLPTGTHQIELMVFDGETWSEPDTVRIVISS